MMRKLAVQFLDQGFHRVMFNAMPMPVFVADKDAVILEYNTAAAHWLGPNPEHVLRRPCGEMLHCVHADEVSQGCGHSESCPDCVVRQSVTAASKGQYVTRQPATLERVSDGKQTRVDLRVGCHPFEYQGHNFNLLMLEGLND